MIVIRFGKWCSKATPMFTYDRVYRNGCEWTPLCIKKFRYINSQPTIDIDTITKAHADIGYKQGYRDGYAEAEPTKIDIERFKKEIADYTNESGYVDIPLSILLDTLNEVVNDKRR